MSLHDEYRTIREGAAIGAISRRAQLAVAGKDRATYLQGLLTNDIVALTPGSGCYAAWLTPQGRMLTDMHVLQSDSMILLDVPFDHAQATLERLDQFLFGEDVQLASLVDTLTSVWVHGPAAAGAIEQVVGPAEAGRHVQSGPAEAGRHVQSGPAEAGPHVATSSEAGPQRDVVESGFSRTSTPDVVGSGFSRTISGWPLYHHEQMSFADAAIVVARIDQLGVPGFCLYVERAREGALVDALKSAGAVAVSSDAIDAARIEAGYPVFDVDMTSDTIPLEAGIEDRAISQTKGCYVGQEIIIRVLHRGGGRVARRLVAMRVDGGLPARAAKLFAGDREVGFVTSAATSPTLGSIALGYVHRDFVAPGTSLLVEQGDGRAQVTVATRPMTQAS